MAIDDERTACWPYVGKEKEIEGAKNRKPEKVHQNVGTGWKAHVG